jgi:hypothetical protein
MPEIQVGIFNGATIDRWKEAPSGNGTQTRTGLPVLAILVQDPFNAGNYGAAAAATGDAVPSGVTLLAAAGVSNGTTIDRLKGDAGVARVSLQAQATAVTGSATAAVNTATSTNLPAVAAKTNYVTGFSVTTQGGSAAAAGLVTLQGTITGTLNYQVGAGANFPVQFIHTFPSPIPSIAANTPLLVSVPALGANTGAVACTIYGYVQ